MKKVYVVALLGLLLTGYAQAQGFPASYPAIPTQSEDLGIGTTGSGPVELGDFIEVKRVIPGFVGSQFNGLGIIGVGGLPLSAFASSSDVAGLHSEVAQLSTLQQRFAGEVRSKLANGMALAGAMDMIRPAAGMANRFGGQVTDYDGRAAVAFNFMHQSGRYDLGAAAGFANGAAMGKLGAGVSW